jgi:hypothetical protein
MRLASGDALGALLVALMLRHSDPNYSQGRGSTLTMNLRRETAIDESTGTGNGEYVFAPIDKLLAELRGKL